MGNAEMSGRCVIVCGGELKDTALVKNNIKPDDFVIAADSGYNYLREAGIEPQLFVGDFDSFSDRESVSSDILPLPTHKDVTDTHAAILEGLDRGYSRFILLGAMGGRADHTFSNLSLLYLLKDSGADGEIIYDNGRITMLRDESAEYENLGGYFSVFPFGGAAKGVTLDGMEYPLDNATLTADNPVGVSNHITGKSGRVTVKSGTIIIMQVTE